MITHLKTIGAYVLKPLRSKLNRAQRGQSIIILAFAFIGMVAMLGLALDLGLVYITRVRLKRAIDAATLAGVVELPAEEEAMNRAIAFLLDNGYGDANFYMAGCIRDVNRTETPSATNLINYPSGQTMFNNLAADDLKALPLDVLSPDANDFYLYNSPDYNDTNGNGVRDPGEAYVAVADLPTFYLDTRSFQVRTFDEDGNAINGDPQCNDLGEAYDDISNGGPFGSSSKLRVYGIVPVRMNFMQFFGFGAVPVADSAIAQNSSNLDVAVVMDTTGSMQFDTICFDCWAPCGGVQVPSPERLKPNEVPCSTNDKYKDFPTNGRAFPIGLGSGFDAVKDPYVCGNGGDCTTNPVTPGLPQPETGKDYIIFEAELYSNNTGIWDPSYRGAEQGYWAIQRTKLASTSLANAATSIDSRPAFVRHMPFLAFSDTLVPFGKQYTQQEAQDGTSPRLEYDFLPNWTGSTYIFLKGKGYLHSNTSQTPGTNNYIFWNVVPFASSPTSAAVTMNSSIGQRQYDPTMSGLKNSSDTSFGSDEWEWIRLGPVSVTSGAKYKFSVFAGGTGYVIDRLVVGNGANWDSVSDLYNNGLDDEPATDGSAQRLAADICNPIYGESVTIDQCTSYLLPATAVNNLNDPLFGDTQPIRGAKEAVKAFVNRLDPSLDQAGFVDFDQQASRVSQLECLQAATSRKGVGSQVNNYPLSSSIMGEFDETECYDEDTAVGLPIGFRNMLIDVEDATDSGGTDIADGLRRGLHTLGVNTDDDDDTDGDGFGDHSNDCNWTKNPSPSGSVERDDWLIGGLVPTGPDSADVTSHCGRGAAATQIIVLLTDGAPNDSTPGDDSDCHANAISPLPYATFPSSSDNYRCIMYYAQIAGNNGVIVYTIGLGVGVDEDLLRSVANETNGEYYYAPSAAQLNIIFNQILANIYVRLVQ